MKKIIISILCTLSSYAISETSEYPKKMIVNTAVANLRFEPQDVPDDLQLPTSDLTNPLQITQMLLGEYLIATNSTHDQHHHTWLKIKTLQQPHYTNEQEWHGFQGWIRADNAYEISDYPKYNAVVNKPLSNLVDADGNKIITVSIGTRLQVTPTDNIHQYRATLPDTSTAFIHSHDLYMITTQLHESTEDLINSIIATAKTFMGSYYSWGGRSTQYDGFGLSSVDCSALINLSFLAHGLQIPRMSHGQFLTSHELKLGAELEPGDLVFFASATKIPFRMNHVMLYLGNEQLLESTYAADHTVRIISFEERIGKPRTAMRTGDTTEDELDEYFVYFGSFFKDRIMLQQLRDNALSNNY